MAVPQGGKSGVDACQRRFWRWQDGSPVPAAAACFSRVRRCRRTAACRVRPRHKRQGTGMAEKIINGFSVVAYATQPEGRVPARAFLETRRLPVKPPKDAVKRPRTPRRRRRKRRRSRKAKSRRIRRPSRKSRSLSRSSSAGAFAARSRRCRPRATRWTASRAWTRKACPTTCRSRPRAARRCRRHSDGAARHRSHIVIPTLYLSWPLAQTDDAAWQASPFTVCS